MDKLETLLAEAGNGRVAPPALDELETLCPFLWQLLTQDQWADGRSRELSTIQIDRVPGGYKITLQDHALWLKKSCMAVNWAEIPQALDRALNDPGVPWEHYKSYRTKGGPVVKEKEKGGRRRRGK